MEGVFQVEQVAGAKALSQEHVWLGLRTPGVSGRLKTNGTVVFEEKREIGRARWFRACKSREELGFCS